MVRVKVRLFKCNNEPNIRYVRESESTRQPQSAPEQVCCNVRCWVNPATRTLAPSPQCAYCIVCLIPRWEARLVGSTPGSSWFLLLLDSSPQSRVHEDDRTPHTICCGINNLRSYETVFNIWTDTEKQYEHGPLLEEFIGAVMLIHTSHIARTTLPILTLAKDQFEETA